MLKVIGLLCIIVAVSSSEDRQMKNFCYYANWSGDIQAVEARFQIADIDPSLCTHLIYAFAAINTETLRLNPSSVRDDNGKVGTERAGLYFEFTGLKKDHPELVTILSVGGAAAGSKGFIQIVQGEENMVEFSNNVAIFLRDRDFDGIDIDWEYPKAYKDKFTQLLKKMRETFEKEAVISRKPRLLLTIATGVGEETIDESYNITEISRHVDYIHVMTYDFHGKWSKVTSFTSPLYSRVSNPAFNHNLSQDWAISRYLEGGAPPQKLVMGLTATVTYFLLNSTQTGVGAPVTGPGPAGKYLASEGQCPYYHLCKVLEQMDVVQNWDPEQKMAYAYVENEWYGYNNPRSIHEKVQYAASKGLAGTMFWSMDLDDFMGECSLGKYPLLKAIHKEIVHIANPNITPVTTTPVTSTPTTEFHPNTNKNGINFYNVRGSSSRVMVPLGNVAFVLMLALVLLV